MKVDFNKLKKALDKKAIVTGFTDPDDWLSIGNMALNYQLCNRFDVGLPNRRTVLLWGESGTGKSFLTGNYILNAQKQGRQIIYFDTEDAVHTEYLNKIGVETEGENFFRITVNTIEQATVAIAELNQMLVAEGKYAVAFDSLSALLSEKEVGEFEKGIQKGDQGQKAKKLKLMVTNINQLVSRYDMFWLFTAHAYLNQDMLNGEGKWILTGGKGLQFLPSISILLTKKKLKGEEAGTFDGVIINTETTKNRFGKPYQKTSLTVPYNKGLDPLDGVLDLFEEVELVSKGGAWYTGTDRKTGEEFKFQRKNFPEVVDRIFDFNEHNSEVGVPEETPEEQEAA